MNPSEKITPDDPRLTAYALDELEPAEAMAVAELVRHSAGAQRVVAEVRAAAQQLSAALGAEPATRVAVPLVAPKIDAARARRTSALLRFPQLYYVTASLAAACFAVVFVVQHQSADAERGSVQHVVAAAPTLATAAHYAMADRDADERATAARMTSAKVNLVSAAATRAERFFATTDVSTSSFPLRVGRESYTAVVEQLRQGRRPSRDTVHVAELINAFNYSWPEAAAGEPVAFLLDDTAAPWSPAHRLVRVGLKSVGAAGAVVAREARVQVDFSPTVVRAWRLLGFEHGGATVGLTQEEGETLRGGDTVTALYEIVPQERGGADVSAPLLSVRLRYATEHAGATREIARHWQGTATTFGQGSADLRFMAGVAAYGMALQGSLQQPRLDVAAMAEWAASGVGTDPVRREFVELMRAVK
ncbi:MAG: von Willebrand factor type A domain-containing protein [Candidatus Didemnitutus sp.]|nr:von Willebrand factor type A domain-containing protein [Candidatus Didemnitutus sp.]